MVWTSPKTWVDDEVVSSVDFNTHLRDNLNALSIHQHTGAAGDGDNDLVDVETLTIKDSGATPSAPGTGKVVLFSESETLKTRAGASGSAKAISLADHTHVASIVDPEASKSTSNEDINWPSGSSVWEEHSGGTDSLTVSVTLSKTGMIAAFAYGACESNAADWSFKIDGNEESSVDNDREITSTVSVQKSAGTYSVTLELTGVAANAAYKMAIGAVGVEV